MQNLKGSFSSPPSWNFCKGQSDSRSSFTSREQCCGSKVFPPSSRLKNLLCKEETVDRQVRALLLTVFLTPKAFFIRSHSWTSSPGETQRGCETEIEETLRKQMISYAQHKKQTLFNAQRNLSFSFLINIEVNTKSNLKFSNDELNESNPAPRFSCHHICWILNRVIPKKDDKTDLYRYKTTSFIPSILNRRPGWHPVSQKERTQRREPSNSVQTRVKNVFWG